MALPNFVEHVPGSPQESFEPGRTQAVRVLDFAWAARFTAAKELLGGSQKATAASGRTYIRRFLPNAHPEALIFDNLPLRSYLWATKIIRTEGLKFTSKSNQPGPNPGGGNANAIAAYDTARLWVQYSTLPFDVFTDDQMILNINPSLGQTLTYPAEWTLGRYVSKTPRPNVAIATLPQGFYKRAGTQIPVVQGIHKTFVHCNLQMTWHEIPQDCVPFKFINPAATLDAIPNCLGKVNSQTFAGYGPGRLLLLGAELRPEINAFGQRIYDITYMMKLFQPTETTGHQHVFIHLPATAIAQNATSWTWGEVTADGSLNIAAQLEGKSIYDWALFQDLFQPG